MGCHFLLQGIWLRDWTCVSCTDTQILYHWATREAHLYIVYTHVTNYTQTRQFYCILLGEREIGQSLKDKDWRKESFFHMGGTWVYKSGLLRKVAKKNSKVWDPGHQWEGKMICFPHKLRHNTNSVWDGGHSVVCRVLCVVRLGRATGKNGKWCFQSSPCSMMVQQRLETSKPHWCRSVLLSIRSVLLWILVQQLGAEKRLVGRGDGDQLKDEGQGF